MLWKILFVAWSIIMAALPALAARTERSEDGYIIYGNERTLEEAERAYAEMPAVRYEPPPDRWTKLAGTRQLLQRGNKPLRVVMLGDSIVNDTSRSAWDLVLQKQDPRCRIEKVTSVRGSTGCWWYRENERVRTFVLKHEPDLVLIGGISQRDDIDSIREVMRQIRAARPQAEFLLMSGAFGAVDPRDEKQWQETVREGDASYRSRLRRLAGETDAAFLDVTAAWGAYVRESGKELDFFKRDPVHANARGEQILGRVLVRFLTVDRSDETGNANSGSARDE
jgi:hypothetical protein